jgi:hypothetical protein
MRTTKWAARIGASFYVLWGIFHLVAANSVYVLAEQSTGMVQGRLLQDATYLVFFAISGILIAMILNWRNDKQGYWMNGSLLAAADIPFILFVLVPRPHSLVAGLGRTTALAGGIHIHVRGPLLGGFGGRGADSRLIEWRASYSAVTDASSSPDDRFHSASFPSPPGCPQLDPIQPRAPAGFRLGASAAF